MRRAGIGGVVFMLGVSCISGLALAADVPHVLVHQGYLTDRDGKPAEETVDMVFAIYQTSEGEDPAPIWESPLKNVPMAGGFYTVELSVDPAKFSLSDQYPDLYLEVRVGKDANVKKLKPRQHIGSVPYSLKCLDWVGDKSGFVMFDKISTQEPLTGGPFTDRVEIGIQPASRTQPGYLSAADWTKFDGKQERVTANCTQGNAVREVKEDGTVACEPVGDITGINTTSPLTGGGTSGDVTISIPPADGSQNGYVTAADWAKFDAKQSSVKNVCNAGSAIRWIYPNGDVLCETDDGTVASIDTGVGLAGGPVTTTGTISLATSYADGSAYDSRFVNEGQTLSVSTAMLQDGVVTSGKLATSYADGSAYDTRFVNTSGDSMTGALTVPADGLSVGADQLVCVNGKVGIGTTNPTKTLDVAGDGKMNLGVAGVAHGHINTPQNLYFNIDSNNDCPGNSCYLTINTGAEDGNGMNLLTVMNSGNVGVGTTNPGAGITVANGRAQFSSNVEPTSGAGVEIGYGSDTGYVIAYDRGNSSYKDLFFQGGGAVIRANGNVGIGTTSPGARLHVDGIIQVSNGNGALNASYLIQGPNRTWAIGSGATITGDQKLTFFDETGGAHRLVIDNVGNVGIGTTNPVYLLHVNGSAGKPGGGSWTDSSDIRLKKNVKALEGTLAKLLRLRGVDFEWKEPEKHGNLKGIQTGMIAQEVEKVFPEWVGTGKDGMKDLTFRGFEALTVEAMRELKAENDQLKERLVALETAVAAKGQGVGTGSAALSWGWLLALFGAGLVVWGRARCQR